MARTLASLLLLLSTACDAQLVAPRDAGMDAATMPAGDAAADSSTSRDAGPAMPDPSCLVPDVDGESIVLEPDPPRAGAAFRVLVSGPTPRTNVEVRICTPLGRVHAPFANVTGTYTWEMSAPAIPIGQSQIIFVADPVQTVYSTRRVHVVDDVADAGTIDAGAADPCAFPEGSLIDGRFEDGLAGLAPPGWQVRDPDAPGRCGDPASHVYVTDPPPGCGGRALAIDARGQWDCYAIQAFTDYSTILGGRTYRVRATVRSEGQDNPGAWFFLGVQWLDGSDRVFGNEQNPRMDPLDYDWRVLEWDLVAPADARRAVVWLTAHYPGRVDVDSLSMIEL